MTVWINISKTDFDNLKDSCEKALLDYTYDSLSKETTYSYKGEHYLQKVKYFYGDYKFFINKGFNNG